MFLFINNMKNTPEPLTETQRNEVRELLQELGEASSKRSKRKLEASMANQPPKKKIKIPVQESPFDGIEQGQSVEGPGLPVICNSMPLVQRVRLILIPLLYDDIPFHRQELVKMMQDDLGADEAIDSGTNDTVRFIIEGNPPIRNLYIYLQPRDEKYIVSNWIFCT